MRKNKRFVSYLTTF